MRDGARITDPDLVDAFRQAAGIEDRPDDGIKVYVVTSDDEQKAYAFEVADIDKALQLAKRLLLAHADGDGFSVALAIGPTDDQNETYEVLDGVSALDKA